jgi:hypothetical protein
MSADRHEPRYTPTELAELYYEFMREDETRKRMKKNDIFYWEHTELVIRFLGYVRNYNLIKQVRDSERECQEAIKRVARQKGQMFGPSTTGDLFTQP